MDKILRLTLLIDFYGDLLTEKQYKAFEQYYMQDLSLNELGELYGVSPQAVRDLIRRTEKILEHYEEKLKLLEKHLEQEKKLEKIKELLKAIKDQIPESAPVENILLKLQAIIESF